VLAGNARKIADLYWSGKETAYAVRVETSAPACFGHEEVFSGAMVRDTGGRSGNAWDGRSVDGYSKTVVPFELVWRSEFRATPIPSMSRARGITFSPNRILKKTTAINRRAAIKSENRKKHRMHCK